jgi:hypothetical protein
LRQCFQPSLTRRTFDVPLCPGLEKAGLNSSHRYAVKTTSRLGLLNINFLGKAPLSSSQIEPIPRVGVYPRAISSIGCADFYRRYQKFLLPSVRNLRNPLNE